AHSTSLAPCCANSSASANPKPREPPVISTTFPLRSMALSRRKRLLPATPNPSAAATRATWPPLNRIWFLLAYSSSSLWFEHHLDAVIFFKVSENMLVNLTASIQHHVPS